MVTVPLICLAQVHYGHSCLVPVDVTKLPCMYVFVDISIDVDHLIATVRHNFAAGTRLIVAGQSGRGGLGQGVGCHTELQ